MKKILGFVLVLLMLFSFPIALAEEITSDNITEVTESADTTEVAEEASTEEPVAEETPVEDASTEVVVAETPEVTEESSSEVIEGVVTEEEVAEAGTTPDNKLLWGLDRAIERISLALTLGKSAKAQKGLAHARERLMEVKAMMAEKRIEAAERAQEQHGLALGKVKKQIEEAKSEGSEEELADETALEEEIANQEGDIQNLKNIKIVIKGQLTSEQQLKLELMLNRFADSLNQAKLKIMTKKEETKNKIKLRGVVMDDQLREKVKEKIKSRGKDSSEQPEEIVSEEISTENVAGESSESEESIAEEVEEETNESA